MRRLNIAVFLLWSALVVGAGIGLPDVAEARKPALSDSLAPQGMYSPTMIGLVALSIEGVLAAGSASTRYPAGSYAIGGFQGLYALTLASSAFMENENPYPRLLMAGGLGYLSYYNFRFQGSHSNRRKFGTNFIGVNATAAAALLVYVLLPDRGFNLLANRNEAGARLDVLATASELGIKLHF